MILRVFWGRHTIEKLVLEKNSLVSFGFPAYSGPKYAFIYAVVCREGMLFGRGCIGRVFSLFADVEFLLGMSRKRLASNPNMALVSFNYVSWL